MADWTHPVCDPCWQDLTPGRQPTRLVDRDVEICCRCGNPTGSGIYVRADPASMLCKGRHEKGGTDG